MEKKLELDYEFSKKLTYVLLGATFTAYSTNQTFAIVIGCIFVVMTCVFVWNYWQYRKTLI